MQMHVHLISAQMYHVFIEDSPLFLYQIGRDEDLLPNNPKGLRLRYPGKSKYLSNYVDQFEKNSRYPYLAIGTEDLDLLWQHFRAMFDWVPAAGGVVYNERDEILFFFRRGSWDWPKGKIDEGEGIEAAALREVEEETGIKAEIINSLGASYHVYKHKGRRVLKPSYWFTMRALPPIVVVLQTEEDIIASDWLTAEAFTALDRPFYASLRPILNGLLKTKLG
jgi:8-oxo-dGTP pyrophosphatase MutT (NUDIX family)